MSETTSEPLNQTQCESMGGTWNDETQTCTLPETIDKGALDQASLLRKIEMLKAQVRLREDQLQQAIGIATRANDERKAREAAEKAQLIQSIQIDGKFPKDELESKSVDELTTIRYTLDRSLEKTFASVAADFEAQRRKREPQLTAGYYDRDTGTWKGGV